MRKQASLALTLAALALAGCGGGNDDEPTAATTPAREAAPQRQEGRPDWAVGAEAVCAEMVAEAKRLGKAVQRREEFPSDPLATTTSLIAPAIPIVATSARRLRALEGQPTSADFEAYVKVYDPILALLRQRVEAGRAGDRERAKDLELQLLDMISLQRQLARSAGLAGCDADFIQVFVAPGS